MAKPQKAKGLQVLHPNQFQVNEAWLVFKLNEAPIRTADEGSLNCVCLMDAASCFILGNVFVPVDESEPSIMGVRQLLQAGWAHKHKLPTTLFIPTGQFQMNLPEEAERQGLAVVRVPEGELMPFIKEARQAFKQHVAEQRHYN